MNAFGWLLFLFIGLPLIELALLIKIGTIIGFWPTIAIVIFTGVLGAALARLEGFRVFRKIQSEISIGNMPKEELIDGLLIFAGGVVLLTPGIITDIWGFAMLIPLTRYWFKRALRKAFDKMIRQHNSTIYRPL